MSTNDGKRQKTGSPDNPDYLYRGIPTVEYEQRDEKPWQRVLSEVTRKGPHLYEPVKSIPSPAFIIVLGVYLLLAYLTQLVEDDMPRVVGEASVARDDSTQFSEETAWRYLHEILGSEPRVSGTRYHLQKTQDLKQLVDGIASQATIPVRTDWQFASGDYWLTFAYPHVTIYQNASNVIALLEGEAGFHSNGTLGTSLLVNCHYDSVPYALGASDNAIFCACMMESLNRLSRRQQRLKHNVIFLFNGAEENPLHGSHAFLQHPWAKGVKNVINLDAAGMNGKANVFQVSDPRLFRIYQRVTRRPSAQSVGEFLFTNGIIPSDTDFRIWRDFGRFHGIDIAFVKWGHVYHTRYDHPDLVRPGVIQNAGDMLLGVVREVADDPQFEDQIPPSAAVYYDYLYAFLVTYSYAAAVAVDVCTALFGLLSVGYFVWLVGLRKSTITELLYAALGRVACLGAGLLLCTVFTAIMVAVNMQLRYLSQPWLVVPIFWLPYVITAVCISETYDAWRTKRSGLNRSIRAMQAQAATRLLMSAVLLILTCVPKLTTMRYIFTVPLFLMSIFSIASMTIARYVRLRAWMQLCLEMAFSLPTVMFLFSIALRLDATLLPIMGRSSSDTPDVTVALVNVGFAAYVTMALSGVELLFSRRRLWAVAAPLAAACLVLMFVPFSPYQDDGPSVQRHYWFHAEVVSYDYSGNITERTSGVTITKHDAYTPQSVLPVLKEKGFNLEYRDDYSRDCERYVYCNLPLFRIRFGEFLKSAITLHTGPPAPFSPESSTRVVGKTCSGQVCTFNVVMTGQPHNTVTILPRSHANLTAWSLESPLLPTQHFLGRPLYVLVHSTATYSAVLQPLEFSLTFNVPIANQSEPVMDVSHHSFKIHHPEDYTVEYRNLVEAMPKYFNIASFLGYRRNYVF